MVTSSKSKRRPKEAHDEDGAVIEPGISQTQTQHSVAATSMESGGMHGASSSSGKRRRRESGARAALEQEVGKDLVSGSLMMARSTSMTTWSSLGNHALNQHVVCPMEA